jgi:hypothetical protein
MEYEIPNRVSLVISLDDTQMGFVRRALIEAARLVGLPLLEQVDYADFILRLPINQKDREKLLDKRQQEKPPEFRLLWKGKDPSPKDGTIAIQDWEFNKRRGKLFGFNLNDFEKEELKRRQIYYQLNGGSLGSMQEIPRNTEIIIVDLNLIYQKENYDATTAQKAFGKYVDDTVKAYGQLEIKFNINLWTPGDAKFIFGDILDASITEGYKAGFYNVIFGRNVNSNDRTAYTTFDVQNTPIATFLYKPGLDGGGFVNRGLRTHALAHELGHAFGITGSEISILGYEPSATTKNFLSDQQVDAAITQLLSGKVKKGVDRKKSGLVLPKATGKIEYFTVFDKLRAGARALSRKV